MSSEAESNLTQQMVAWRRELIDFSRRNRLLNLSSRATSVTLLEPSYDEVVGKLLGLNPYKGPMSLEILPHYFDDDQNIEARSFGLFDDEEVEEEESEYVPPLNQNQVRCSVNDQSKLLANLRTLARKADQEFLDKGIRILYLAVGAFSWREKGDDWCGPILLIPVLLKKLPNSRYEFYINEDEDIALNPALIEKLRQDHDINLEVSVDEDAPLDVIEGLLKLIKGKTDFSITDHCEIGVFSFAKDVMYRDLMANEAVIVANPMVQALALGGLSKRKFAFDVMKPEVLDDVAPPSKLMSILDADSTQRTAIMAAKEGKSFVLDGPPGTGKSQTIANIIAELIAAGRSVLFVSEKAAALEVVQSRLEAAGLGTFLLPLHSQKVSRKDFAATLAKSRSERAMAGKELSNAEIERLNKTQKQLSSYVSALNELRRPLGISLYQAIGQYAALEDVAIAPVPAPSKNKELHAVARDFLKLEPSQQLEIEDAASMLSRSWTQIVSPHSYFWNGVTSPRDAQRRLGEISVTINSAISVLENLHFSATEVSEDSGVPYDGTLPSLRRLGQIIDFTARGRHQVPNQWLTTSDWDSMGHQIADALNLIAGVQKLVAELDSSDSGWRTRPATASATLNVLLQDYRDSLVPLPEFSNPVSSFSDLAKSLKDLEKNGRDMVDLGNRLATKLGDSPKTATPDYFDILSDAADLAAVANRPESIWFNAVGLTAAKDALARVQPLIEKYRSQFTDVCQIFKPQISEFAIEKVFGADGQTPNLSPLSGVGRSNKKALAALTVSGKLGKEEKSQLAEVLKIAELRRLIENDADAIASLGQSYFKGIDTDFDAINGAIEAARVAIVLLGEADAGKLSAALGRAAIDATETAAIGRRLREAAEGFLSEFQKCTARAIGFDHNIEDSLAELATYATKLTEAHDLFDTLLAVGAGRSIREVLQLADEIERTHAALIEFDNQSESIELVLGNLYQGLETDVENSKVALSWTEQLRDVLGTTVSSRVATRLCVDQIAEPDVISERVSEYTKAAEQVVALFAKERRKSVREGLEFDVESGLAYLADLVNHIEQVSEEVTFQESAQVLTNFGLGGVLDYMVNAKSPAANIPGIVKKALLAAWIESIFDKEHDTLRPAEKVHRDQLVADFAAGDKKLRAHAAAKVSQAASDARPNAIIGSIGVINAQAAMKRKHMRISDLLSRVTDVAMSIKPCFMMSPLSVSTFLPPDFHFDTVIFDEASQLTSANAVNAIYRGSQLIIAGDEKQLPPSNLFAASLSDDGSDEYSEGDIAEYESLLKQAKSGGFQEIGLRWHYRSRHESLITYSNYSFYDGELVTYPGAIQESESLGVKFIHVEDGVYSRSGRNTNVTEAQKVVERIFYHATHNPHLSLGVVAFSLKQADEIENQLEMARKSRPDLDDYFVQDRLNGFFVKNLENVQGDERDIIIFSVGYGRDENGKLTMNFGPPVNNTGGWRRLNVAFTRARNRVELVSSITAGDFSGTNTNINYLKRYFDYAERGMNALAAEVDPIAGGPESPFEEEVLRVINAWGYKVTPQVGQAGFRIDMAISHPDKPGEFVLGIECDGAAYHSSKVAKDRDRLRQEVLENLGWRLYRIWGPSWYRSPVNAKRDLKTAIEVALEAGPRTHGQPETKTTKVEHFVFEAEVDETSRFVKPYWDVRPQAKRLTASYSVDQLSNFILEVVEQEGPISRNLVRRRCANALSVNLTAKLKMDVDARIEAQIKAKSIVEVDFDAVATKKQSGIVVARTPDRHDALTKRAPVDVPFIEVVAAVAHVVEIGHSVEMPEIEDQVVRKVFGFDRVTAQWRDLIELAIKDLAADSWCRLEDGRLTRGISFPD
jgi:very-short-patch-repair endonuclease